MLEVELVGGIMGVFVILEIGIVGLDVLVGMLMLLIGVVVVGILTGILVLVLFTPVEIFVGTVLLVVLVLVLVVYIVSTPLILNTRFSATSITTICVLPSIFV